eukprot:TRINITY_DN22863_c0_g1_i1.p1 TRINITY_DN22863_c0_g1~~TRINITY_DN22863_c0_g1_i1.p1  ORF type:complete len:152 (-),score=26.19 TRINITY_DN22863_c0_g1_i1:28-483(-)
MASMRAHLALSFTFVIWCIVATTFGKRKRLTSGTKPLNADFKDVTSAEQQNSSYLELSVKTAVADSALLNDLERDCTTTHQGLKARVVDKSKENFIFLDKDGTQTAPSDFNDADEPNFKDIWAQQSSDCTKEATKKGIHRAALLHVENNCG